METLLLLALGTAAAFTVWGCRRIEVFSSGTNYDSRAPLVPCWEETRVGEGGYRYGRYQCVDYDLMEIDARAKRGDYQIPYTG